MSLGVIWEEGEEALSPKQGGRAACLHDAAWVIKLDQTLRFGAERMAPEPFSRHSFFGCHGPMCNSTGPGSVGGSAKQ